MESVFLSRNKVLLRIALPAQQQCRCRGNQLKSAKHTAGSENKDGGPASQSDSNW